MDIVLRGTAICIREQDGTQVEITDSVSFYLISNHYVYIEYRLGSGMLNATSIMCLLFNFNDYIQTGNITVLSISKYINSRPFNVDSYGIEINNNSTRWNQIWDQELYF
jgi:hypothetical protein